MDPVQNKQHLFDRLAPIWPEALLEAIQGKLTQSRRKLVVLDDDPTGGQAIHGVHMLSEWAVDNLVAEFNRSGTFFVLTNTRSLPASDARALTEEVGRNLRQAAALAKADIAVLIRGDSTQRERAYGLEREKRFWGPIGVTVDDENRIFVCEQARNRIQVYRKQSATFVGPRL